MIMIEFLKPKIFFCLDRFTMFREHTVPDYLNQNKPSLIILPKGNIIDYALLKLDWLLICLSSKNNQLKRILKRDSSLVLDVFKR